MSFFTCRCDLPQNEHFSRSPPSPIRAPSALPSRRPQSRIPHSRHVRLDGTLSRLVSTTRGAPCVSPPQTRSPGSSEFFLARSELRLLPVRDHVVDEAVFVRFLGREDLVTVDVLLDLFEI